MSKDKTSKIEEHIEVEEVEEEELSFSSFLDEFMGDADEEEQEQLEGAPDTEEDQDNRIGAFLSVPQAKTPTPKNINNGMILSLGLRDEESDEYVYVYSEEVAMVPLESVTEKVKWGGRYVTIGGRRCFTIDPENPNKRITSCGSTNGKYPWTDRLGEWVHEHRIGFSGAGQIATDENICKICPLKDWTRVGGKGIKPRCQESFTWVVYIPEQEWMKATLDEKGKERITKVIIPGRISSFMGKSTSVQMALKGVKKGNSGALDTGKAISGLSSFNITRGSVEFVFSGDKITEYQRSIVAYFPPDSERVDSYERDDIPTEAYGNAEYSFVVSSSTTDVYPDGKPTIARSYNKVKCYPVLVDPRLNNFKDDFAAFVPYPEIADDPLTVEQYMDMQNKWKFYLQEQQVQMRGVRVFEDMQSTLLMLEAPQESIPLYEEDDEDDSVFDATLLDD